MGKENNEYDELKKEKKKLKKEIGILEKDIKEIEGGLNGKR